MLKVESHNLVSILGRQSNDIYRDYFLFFLESALIREQATH